MSENTNINLQSSEDTNCPVDLQVKKPKPVHIRPALYAFLYEKLKIIAKDFGYNLVLHGSMNRDLDLIAIPWIDNPKDEFEMIQAMHKDLIGVYSEQKDYYLFSKLPGGRNNYVININRGGHWNNYTDEQYYLDISITPKG